MIKNLLKNVLEKYGYYKIEDIQHWGHCGCCGVLIDNVFPKYWAFGVCNKCLSINMELYTKE